MDERTLRGLFDRAVAYFNAGAFHEAHEDWETLWHEAEGPRRLWLQGLIQYAAAFYHHHRGYHATGFVKLMRGAHAKAAGYAGDTHGMRFDDLLRQLEPWRAHAEAVARGRRLREEAPKHLPVIRYEDGVEPAPFLPDEEPDAG